MVSCIRQQTLCLNLIIVVDASCNDANTGTNILRTLYTRDHDTAGSRLRSLLQLTGQDNRVGCQILRLTGDSLGIGHNGTLYRTFIGYSTLQGNISLIVDYITWHTGNRSLELTATGSSYLLTQVIFALTIVEA